MKISSLLIAMVVVVAAASGAFASEKTKAREKAAAGATSQKPKTGIQKKQYTGSYIKENLRQSGPITDGVRPLYVLDSKAIQNSGAADLRQLLVRQGVNR